MRSLLSERPVECIRSEGGPPMLVGYAAVYYDEKDEGTEYNIRGNVKERIMPGAFDRALADSEDIISTFNHNPNQLLGRTSSGTLRLSLDKTGLRYELDLPDTQLGRDIEVLSQRGDIDGSSFWFDFHGSEYNKRFDGKNQVWELLEVKGLKELGPGTAPAYKATSAFKRSEELVDSELSIEFEKRSAQTQRLRLLSKTINLENPIDIGY